jgi:hypothetical protein
MAADPAQFAIFAGIIWLLICVILISLVFLSVAFWIWMIIDCAQRDFRKDNDKVIWILVLIFLGALGAIVYYFVVKRSNKK